MLEINQRIEIEVKSGEYEGLYSSRVEEINTNDLKIALPMEKGAPIPLRVRTLIAINFIGRDAVYSGDAFIMSRELHPVPILIVTLPTQFKRIQRRDYVRVGSSLPIVIVSCDEKEIELKTTTYDISGGGISFFLTREQESTFLIKKRSTLNIHINFSDDRKIPVLAQVARTEINFHNNQAILAVHFISIEERDREQIISYVFQRQRELKKLGLL